MPMPVTKCILLTCDECSVETIFHGATMGAIKPEMNRLGWKRSGKTVKCPSCTRGSVRVSEPVTVPEKLRSVEKLIPQLER